MRSAVEPFTNIFATICANIFVMVVRFDTVENPGNKSHNLIPGVFRTQQEININAYNLISYRVAA